MSAHEKNALPDPKEIAKTYAEVAQRASNLITGEKSAPRVMTMPLPRPLPKPISRPTTTREANPEERGMRNMPAAIIERQGRAAWK